MLAAGGGCTKQPAARPPADVTFYWTCDAHGRLEPCGCFSGQHGGLSRISTLLRGGTMPDGLRADAGNAIAGAADYHQIQYRYLQRAFWDLGYAALNMGEREAQLSADDLRRLRAAAPTPDWMVSANLLDRASGQRLLAPYRIVEWRGQRGAFVGVVGEVAEESLGAGVAVEPARSALGKVLPEIKGRADVIVLLAYADEPTMRALADEFYELDLILGGKVKQPSQQVARQNRSVLLWTTNETKALGTYTATVGGRERFATKEFNVQFVHEKIPQDERFTRLAQDYRDEVRRTPLRVDDPTRVGDDEVPGVRPAAGYVGSEACAPCHATAYKTWEQSSHAWAFRSLVARQSDADPSCVGCHSVGFGTATGYRREYAGTKLANVGCESCHGPGSEHLSDITQATANHTAPLYHYRPIGASDCTTCHYGEFSRPFKYDEFWAPIRHGKEPPRRAETSPNFTRRWIKQVTTTP